MMYLATGVGGVIGCIFAGLVTEYSHPKWVFFYYSFVGVIVTICACQLTKESEKDQKKEILDSDISTSQENYEFEYRRQRREMGEIVRQVPKREGFCFNLKKNCIAIGRSLILKQIYFLVIFFLVKGIINPSFEEFSYFFLLNVIKISKFVFAILVLVG